MQPVLHRFRLNALGGLHTPSRQQVFADIELLLLARGFRDMMLSAEIAGEVEPRKPPERHRTGRGFLCRHRVFRPVLIGRCMTRSRRH